MVQVYLDQYKDFFEYLQLIKKLENLLKQTRTLHFLENQQPFLEISFYLLVLIKISRLKTFMKK